MSPSSVPSEESSDGSWSMVRFNNATENNQLCDDVNFRSYLESLKGLLRNTVIIICRILFGHSIALSVHLTEVVFDKDRDRYDELYALNRNNLRLIQLDVVYKIQ